MLQNLGSCAFYCQMYPRAAKLYVSNGHLGSDYLGQGDQKIVCENIAQSVTQPIFLSKIKQ
jgi:hypothetical protein